MPVPCVVSGYYYYLLLNEESDGGFYWVRPDRRKGGRRTSVFVFGVGRRSAVASDPVNFRELPSSAASWAGTGALELGEGGSSVLGGDRGGPSGYVAMP